MNAEELCNTYFSATSDNCSWTKAAIRKQFIDEMLRSSQFSGDIIAQSRGYTGRSLDVGDGEINFTLLKGERCAAVIHHVRSGKKLPKPIMVNEYLAGLPMQASTPLYPQLLLFEEDLPSDLDGFFVIPYSLCADDPASIASIDVVVPNGDCSDIYTYAYHDLIAYAETAIEDSEPALLELKDILNEDMLITSPSRTEAPTNHNESVIELDIALKTGE